MPIEEGAGLVWHAVETIWNRGELDVADALFAPDYVNHGGLIPDVVRGPEAIKVSVALYRRAFPNLQIAVDDLVSQGQTVALRWAARNAPAARGAANARSGEQGALEGVTFVRFAGRLIAESWTYWDTGSALRRLGPASPRTDRPSA